MDPKTDSFSGRRILLVDDDAISLRMLSAILGNLGIDTVLASSGNQALGTLAESCDFDLILMDCRMADGNGPQTAVRIRGTAPWQTIPIVAMTGSVDPEELHGLLQSCMDDYILKPVILRNLVPMLERWIHVRRPRP